MISFAELELGAGMPIYIQIILYVKRGMVAGTIRDGDEMPSRRALSALLGVNPNTIQKAYRILEDEGLVCSHTGARSYACVGPERVAQIRRQLLEDDARTLIAAMKQMEVTKEDALQLVEVLWEEEKT